MAKTGTGRYAPVVTDLRARITGGDLTPGDWLPSEAQLMEQYGVTRYSAREAIKRLAEDGLIVVVDGRGSHVRARTDRARHSDTRGLVTDPTGAADPSAGAAVRDAEYSEWAVVEDPATYRSSAGTDLALTLGVPEHTPVFGVDRLLAQSGPAGSTGRRMLYRLIVPMTTCTRVPDLATDPFGAPDQLYAAIHAVGITFAVTEHVRAAAPTPDDAASLSLPSGAPVLVTRRVLRDDHGVALAMEETRRNGEDTQLTYTVVPTPTPTPTPHTAPNLAAVATAPTTQQRHGRRRTT